MSLESVEVSREAKVLFLAFTERLAQGERLVFENVLRGHPGLTRELLALRRRWMGGTDLREIVGVAESRAALTR